MRDAIKSYASDSGSKHREGGINKTSGSSLFTANASLADLEKTSQIFLMMLPSCSPLIIVPPGGEYGPQFGLNGEIACAAHAAYGSDRRRLSSLERQLYSAHRYAKGNDHLLILGPANPMTDHKTPRYLFITPFSSPTHLEVTSEDTELREPPMALVSAGEAATINQKPTDPFSLTQDALSKLSG